VAVGLPPPLLQDSASVEKAVAVASALVEAVFGLSLPLSSLPHWKP